MQCSAAAILLLDVLLLSHISLRPDVDQRPEALHACEMGRCDVYRWAGSQRCNAESNPDLNAGQA
jgi:hypothetical protein